MDKIFIFADGDSIGSLVGAYVLKDDLQSFVDQSKSIRQGNELIANWILSVGGEVYNNEGDEIVGSVPSENASQLEEIRQKYEHLTGHSITMGVGNTLSQSGKALIAGKLTGKNKIVEYDESVEDVLRQAHDAAMSGEADPEQQKMDEHYISSISDEDQEEQAPNGSQDFYEEDLMAQPEMESEQEEYLSMEPDGAEEMPAEEGMPEYSEEEMPSEENLAIPTEEMEMPMDSEIPQDEMMPEDASSDFESEEPIQLDTENAVGETGEEEEKSSDMMAADGMPNEMAEDQAPASEEEIFLEEDPEMLEDELGDVDGREELLQRIAANLDAFKQNRDLIEQIKQAKPDLYQSILGLLHNMIELASMIDPSFSEQEEMPEGELQEEDPAVSQEEQMIRAVAEEEDPNLPKQSGWQG